MVSVTNMSLWKRVLKLFKRTDEIKNRLLDQLLDDIRSGKNDKAMSMLNNDLIRVCDDERVLLHRAAAFGNEIITRHLLKLGYEVDSVDEATGETPLMLAVLSGKAATVKVLLDANANIQVNNANGRNALQMVFTDLLDSHSDILELFLRRLQSESTDTDELCDKLMSAGCNLYCAMYLNDLEVIERMLQRGVDVNSRGCTNMTCLHFAAMHGKVALTELLIDNGADVNALDKFGCSPLILAAHNANKKVMQLLLEAGADPNAKSSCDKRTALSCVIENIPKMPTEEINQCLELLFRHGAMLHVSSIDSVTLLAWAWSSDESKKIMTMMNYLAMLRTLDKPICDSLLPDNLARFSWKIPALIKLSQQCLVYKIWDNVTVLDLLTASDVKMRIQVCNDKLMSKLQQFLSNDQYKLIFPYYCNMLSKRISKARRAVKLKDALVSIFSQMVNSNYNVCYVIAENVLDYLNDDDLELLISL